MKLAIVLTCVVACALANPTAPSDEQHAENDVQARMSAEERATLQEQWIDIKRVCNVERCNHMSEECHKCTRTCLKRDYPLAGEAMSRCVNGEPFAVCRRAKACTEPCFAVTDDAQARVSAG